MVAQRPSQGWSRRTWVVLAVIAVIALGASGALVGGLLGAFPPSSSPGPVASSPSPGLSPVASPSFNPSPSPSSSASPGQSPSPTPGPSASATPTGDYVVQPGDSLSAIAAEMGFSLCAVEAANPQLGPTAGRSWGLLYPGDVVHRPTAEAACPPGGGVTTPSPPPVSPTPALNGYGVMVDLIPVNRNMVGSGFSGYYTISIVSTDGTVRATAKAALSLGAACPSSGSEPGAPTQFRPLPALSLTRDRVYYLDGDNTVRYLMPDGTTAPVATVPGSATISSAFSVSADDRRLAVSVTDYSSFPIRVSLYVEDLGGANHREIYSKADPADATAPGGVDSSTIWPAGWHSGQLVLGYHKSTCGYPGDPWLYNAQSYHVVDPETAIRSMTIGSDGYGYVTEPTFAGTVQEVGDSSIRVLDWSGAERGRVDLTPRQCYLAHLSPAGRSVVASCAMSVDILWPFRAQIASWSNGNTEAWIDERRVGFGSNGPGSQAYVYELDTKAETFVRAGGDSYEQVWGKFVGRLPNDLDSPT